MTENLFGWLRAAIRVMGDIVCRNQNMHGASFCFGLRVGAKLAVAMAFYVTIGGCERESDRPRGVAWEISKDGRALGVMVPTLHFVERSHARMPARLEALVRDAQVIAVEFNIADKILVDELLSCRRIVLERMQPEKVPSELQAEVKKVAEGVGIQSVKPAADMASLADQLSALSIYKKSFDLVGGTDKRAIEIALDLRKEIVSLERPCNQVEAAARASQVWNLVTIRERLAQVSSQELGNVASDLSFAWANGDFESMRTTWLTYLSRFPAESGAASKYIADRNASMVSSVVRLLDSSRKGSIVVFVGLGHFIGDGNILELMAGTDYQLKFISL